MIQPGGAETPLSSIDPLRFVLGAGYRDPAGRFGVQAYLTRNSRKERDRTTGVCSAACYRPPASAVVDLTAFWRVSDNLTLRAGLFNLFDNRYALWGDVTGLLATSAIVDAYTQPGRNVRASLSIRF